METKLLMLALQRLSDEVESLKLELANLKEDVVDSRKCLDNAIPHQIQTVSDEDELMDTRKVLEKLGICYNTLNKLIKQGLIKPIRINQRRLRFTKISILKYIRSYE